MQDAETVALVAPAEALQASRIEEMMPDRYFTGTRHSSDRSFKPDYHALFQT
jgi:hypothetical protein